MRYVITENFSPKFSFTVLRSEGFSIITLELTANMRYVITENFNMKFSLTVLRTEVMV